MSAQRPFTADPAPGPTRGLPPRRALRAGDEAPEQVRGGSSPPASLKGTGDAA
jgi:hypothetical protein